MSLGYFLILAVLILGGIIATLGDRIGSKVGKARLSLFNLRPKKTAVLITILTGVLIAASTMGLLLLVSRGVRDRLLNFEDILRNRRQDLDKVQADLAKVGQDKQQVQEELERVRNERLRVKEQLDRINQSLKGALDRQRQTEGLRLQVETQRNQIQAQYLRVSGQAAELQADIGQLQREQQVLLEQRNRIAAQIGQRDREIAQQERALDDQEKELLQRDQDIATRDKVISQREKRLQELEQQQAFLQSELEQLAQIAEQSAQLRVGVPAVVRNQPLAFGVVQVAGVEQARSAIDAMLGQANRLAVSRIRPTGVSADTPIVQIERSEIERLLTRVGDGQPYVVRVLSAANYLLGESLNDRRGVRVFIEVSPNRTVFKAGDVVVSQFIDNPSQRSSAELQNWITELINAANFRARQRGILAESSNVRYPAVQAVVEQLQQADSPVEVRVIAAEETATAGPLKLEFIAIKDGQVILRTQS
jgi:uncharacterized protein (DUF3084 family)